MSRHIDSLRQAALDGTANGWRPYSNFAVGAAVLTVDDQIYGGAGNVECANYTLTKHAEETAICAALADGALVRCGRKFVQAIFLPCVNGAKIMPCGGCRQFIWEFAADDAEVFSETPDGHIVSYTMKELLPEAFGPDDLGIV